MPCLVFTLNHLDRKTIHSVPVTVKQSITISFFVMIMR